MVSAREGPKPHTHTEEKVVYMCGFDLINQTCRSSRSCLAPLRFGGFMRYTLLFFDLSLKKPLQAPKHSNWPIWFLGAPCSHIYALTLWVWSSSNVLAGALAAFKGRSLHPFRRLATCRAAARASFHSAPSALCIASPVALGTSWQGYLFGFSPGPNMRAYTCGH